MKKPDPKKIAEALTPHVKTLLVATAFAQCERERVDKIQRKVLADQIFHGRKHISRDEEVQYRVTEPRESYHMDELSAKRYHDTLNAIHVANGYAKAAEGYCPALVAETLQTEAEWAVIEAAQAFFPDISNNRLLCGTKDLGGLELRKKWLDLCIGLVVNYPGFSLKI